MFCGEPRNGHANMARLTNVSGAQLQSRQMVHPRDRITKQRGWLRNDQLGYVDGSNLYEAYGSAPAARTDPSGQFYGVISLARLLQPRVVEEVETTTEPEFSPPRSFPYTRTKKTTYTPKLSADGKITIEEKVEYGPWRDFVNEGEGNPRGNA